MRRLLLSALPLFLAAGQAGAQSYTLNEGFEGADVPPSGWTMRVGSDATTNKYKWEQVKYTSNPLNLRSGYTHGGDYAMMVSSGKNNATYGSPDSWLITPLVGVNAGDYLSFMMAYAPVFNAVATVPEDQRIKFAVLVSTAGTDAEAFTDTLAVFAPYSETDWRQKVYSLDKYAGKKIYIAFHEFGNATVGPVTLNRTWIDDVKVGQTASSDFVATELVSPCKGPEASQNVTFKFANNGIAPHGLTVSYKVNDGATTTEMIDPTTLTGDTATYTFNMPATLTEGDNTVKVWATADNDGVHDNDTLTTKVTIEKTFSLPYEMTADNLGDGWTYTYHSGKLQKGTNVGWWQVPDYNTGKYYWTYKTGASKESLLVGQWFKFAKGKVKMNLTYTSGTDVPLTVTYDTSDDADGSKAASKEFTLKAAAENGTSDDILIDVPEDGKYKLSFKVGSDYAGPFVINTLSLEKVAQGDVAVTMAKTRTTTAVDTENSVFATVKNYSNENLTNIPVKVEVDGDVVYTDTVASIASGEETTIMVGRNPDKMKPSFGISFATEGTHTVKVYSAFENDTDQSNDTVAVSVYAYDKYAVPYAESFENEKDNKCWTAEDKGGSVLNWTIGSAKAGNVNWAKDGENAAYMSSVANTEHDAELESPYIHVAEPGKLRLSYYYTTRMKATNATDTTFLEVTLESVKTDTIAYENPDGVETYYVECVYDTTRCDTITDANVGKYRQGYLLADIPEAGDYYVTFRNYGKGHDVVLDDIRLDQAADLALIDARQTAKSGYGNTVNTIAAQIANHGAKPVSNFEINLKTKLADGTETVKTETYAQTLAAGDSITYYFKDIDISAADTYTYTVSVTASDDTDDFNNTWTLDPITSYANATLPYTADFDTDDQQAQWTLNGTWQTGVYSSSSSAYNGTGAISHHKKAADENGDWAYSGCIEIPAGTYDLSFFYRTYLNGKTSKMYAQNFALYLGKEPSAEAMTQNIYTSDADVVAPEKRYKKVDETFTVEEDGKYYIGVKCTSSSAYGVLYIDNISIRESGVNATELKSYKADFNEWHKYDPSSQFAQWIVSEDGSALETSQTVFNAGNPTLELPGLIVSPAFSVKKGCTLKYSFDYGMNVDDAANLTDAEKDKMGTLLYMLNADNPDSLTVKLCGGSRVNSDDCGVAGSYKMTDDGVYYFAIRLTGADNCISETAKLTYNVANLEISAEEPTGITSLNASAEGKTEVYSSNGMLVGTFNSVAEAMKECKGHGIYMIKSAATGKTVKVVR